MKIQWGRVLLLAVAAGLIIVLIRGCAIARKRDSGELPPLATGIAKVRVYDTRKEAVAEMYLEEYMVGVVAGEMPMSFPLEALKAQAVAARSYTAYHALHGGCGSHDADVCTSSGCCQAYSSDESLQERWGASYEKNLAKVRQAVSETAGQVLLYNGAPIDALYHSASGGNTENVEDVYKNTLPYLRGVESRAEAGTSRLMGEKSFTTAAFQDKVNKAYPNAKLKAAELKAQLEIQETTASGRVKSMRLGGVMLTGRQMRNLCSLDSSLFTFAIEGNSIVFYTKGFGHGVGMSQTGANAMALGGRSYQEILLYYYTDVEIGLIAAQN